MATSSRVRRARSRTLYEVLTDAVNYYINHGWDTEKSLLDWCRKLRVAARRETPDDDVARMTYWYSVDWVQINVDMQLANTVINGSNNPINPLYYNQDGIDRLQQVAQGVFNTGVSYGLVNGQPVVNVVPFRTYIKNNPNDYGIGRYAGLSAVYTPMRGFVEIIFNVNVTMQLS